MRSRIRKHTPSVRARSTYGLLAACAGWGVLAIGCGGNEEGMLVPNAEPETEITSQIPRDSSSVFHILTIEFLGRDIDGTVPTYEYLVHTYPRSVASIGDIVVPTPSDDDPRWTAVNVSRAELTLTADTLRADPRGNIGEGRQDRWHTFFVRAIDNEGATDPTPAHRTFSAYSLGPQMALLEPVVRDMVAELPVTFVMQWDGFDDGINSTRDPVEARWVLLPAQLDASDQPIGFPNALYDLPDGAWGPWRPFAAADTTGREARFFDVIATQGDSTFVFAVQGRDDGGAVTPQFRTNIENGNNMAVLKVRSDIPPGPGATLTETFSNLGSWTFEGAGLPGEVVSAAGVDTVVVTWSRMTTRDYGGREGQYRYGWNVQDPGNDAEWSDWGRFLAAPLRVMTLPTERFDLQLRDHLGQITTATLFFQRP